MTPKRIIWHHSAYQSDEHQFDKINEWHKQRGFPISSMGFYVGYHYVIERDGDLKIARKDDEMGAHDQGENIDSIGICLAGDFSKDVPTADQMHTFEMLLRQLLWQHGMSINAIEPHRRDDETECPGKNLPDNWPIGLL